VSFQASDFEFRNRFWIIASIYGVTFALYRVDPTNITIALTLRILRWASPGTGVTIDAPNFDSKARLFFAFGTILLVLSALIRSWATAYLKSGVVHDSAIHSELLVADGPYRHVRNPLYLGTLATAMGLAAAGNSVWLALLFAVIFLLVYLPAIELEEQHLTAILPGYREFAARVPLLLPKWPSGWGKDAFSGALYWKNQEYQALAGWLAGVIWLIVREEFF